MTTMIKEGLPLYGSFDVLYFSDPFSLSLSVYSKLYLFMSIMSTSFSFV